MELIVNVIIVLSMLCLIHTILALILFMEERLIKLKPIWLRHIIFIIFLPALPLYMKREWIYRKSLISANIFLKLMDV